MINGISKRFAVLELVKTKIFCVDPSNPDERAIEICCEILLSGGIVVFPTETVYGLGASAFNGYAIKKIFIAKNRPMNNPLIVHIANKKQLYEVVEEVPKEIEKALDILWPGPVTFLFRKSGRVAPEATAGLPTVAVRMPAHPVALKLIECAGPLVAPSANISGRPSPTTGFHALMDMFGRVDAVIDSGETIYGVESTVIDTLSKPMRLLRPGATPVEKVAEILKQEIVVPPESRGLGEYEEALAPGMKHRHYAPETPIILVEGEDTKKVAEEINKIMREYIEKGKKVALILSKETAETLKDAETKAKVIVYGSKRNMFEIAKNIFKTLRELDRIGVDIAIAEGIEEKGLGLAVMNRLRKASIKIVFA